MDPSRGPEYQRTIIGYHGCDQEVAQQVLLGQRHLRPSHNDFDWLGAGVYFWEHAPARALDFAREQKQRGKLETPYVLGAYIHLGRCFDLTDLAHTHQLEDAFALWSELFEHNQKSMPTNQSSGPHDHDLLLRDRDCALLNWYFDQLDEEAATRYDYQTVRGVFQEGPAAFEGSAIRTKTHVQVAVRDPSCILGYFLPTTHFEEVEHE